MKKLIILSSFIFTNLLLFSQNTFWYQKHFEDATTLPFAVEEDTLGNVLVLYEKGQFGQFRDCFLMVLSPQGEFIKETQIDMVSYTADGRIETINNKLYIITTNFSDNEKAELAIFEISNTYETILINRINYANKSFFRPQIVNIENDTVIFATGIYDDYAFSSELLFIKFTNTWDTICTISYPNSSFFDIKYDKFTQTYNAFGEYSLMDFNKNLEITNTYSFYGPCIYTAFRKFNNKYLVFGNSHIGNNIELSMYNSVGTMLDDVQIGDRWQQVASNRPIANSTNGNFYGYSYRNEGPPSLPYPADLYLVKFDSNMNILFEKYYPHYRGLFATDIAPSADGGCIMISTIYDTTINKTELGLLVLKVDSLGNYTPTNIQANSMAQNIAVYPNPGNNEISIELPENMHHAFLKIYAITGQELLSKPITILQQTISTSELPKGLFIYTIEANHELISKGKWVKE